MVELQQDSNRISGSIVREYHLYRAFLTWIRALRCQFSKGRPCCETMNSTHKSIEGSVQKECSNEVYCVRQGSPGA